MDIPLEVVIANPIETLKHLRHHENPLPYIVYLTAILCDPKSYEFLHPTMFSHPDLADVALDQYGLLLEYTHFSIRTYDRCFKCVSQRGKGVALCWVPPDLRDYDMCRKAIVSSGGAAIKYTPKLGRKTQSLVLLALSLNGMLIRLIPKIWLNKGRHLREKAHKMAVKTTPKAILAISSLYWTFELFALAFKSSDNPASVLSLFKMIGVELPLEIYKLALSMDRTNDSYKQIPSHCRTMEMNMITPRSVLP